jgi:hypothetical protein
LQKAENHRFDSDAQTLVHFTRFTLITSRWRRISASWRSKRGKAACRSSATRRWSTLWAEALRAHDQWIIGEDMLFAPVVTEGSDDSAGAFSGRRMGAFVHRADRGGTRHARDRHTLGTPAVFVQRARWLIWWPRYVKSSRDLVEKADFLDMLKVC